MVATMLENDIYPYNYDYYIKDHVLIVNDKLPIVATYGNEIKLLEEFKIPKNELKNVLDMRSKNETKCFIRVIGGVYHFLADTMGYIFEIYDIDPNCKLYLDLTTTDARDKTILNFMFKLLDDLGVKYEIFDNNIYENKVKYIIFNNSYIMGRQSKVYNPIHKWSKFIDKYLTNPGIKPTQKSYMARKYQVVGRNGEHPNNNTRLNNDIRMFDEEVLIEYLSKNGWDIVVPEERFLTFEDQFNYFYATNKILSVTSGGLTNAIFMQDQQMLIEIVSPLLISISPQHVYRDNIDLNLSSEPIGHMIEQHHFYHALAYAKLHQYIGVPNFSRDPMDFINLVEKNKHLQEIILG